MGLFLAFSDGSNEHRLLGANNSDYGPVWAPDGSSIVFTSDRAGSADLFRVRPDGSGLERLTTNPAYDDQAAFSPDGKQLVFVSTRGGGMARLWRMDLASRLSAMVPRDNLIMFARLVDDAYEIYTIKPEGTGLKRLTFTHGNEAHMAWSPDGEPIAFASSRMGFKDEAAYTDAPQPYGELFVMRYDGTHVEQITDNQWEDGAPAWQPVMERHLSGRK